MQVWQDDYMRLEIDPARHFVRQVRSSRAYVDLTTLEQSLDQLVSQLSRLERAEYVLLHDLRASRGRNDPSFEAAIRRVRPRMFGGFRRVAILVATKVGQLQVQRLEQTSSEPAHVFLDEAEAMRWLLAS
jgi:hypothetical protein